MQKEKVLCKIALSIAVFFALKMMCDGLIQLFN
jgi:hypothetical protein